MTVHTEMIKSIVITVIVILPHTEWFNYHRVSSLRGGHFYRPVKEITIARKDKERKYINWKRSFFSLCYELIRSSGGPEVAGRWLQALPVPHTSSELPGGNGFGESEFLLGKNTVWQNETATLITISHFVHTLIPSVTCVDSYSSHSDTEKWGELIL